MKFTAVDIKILRSALSKLPLCERHMIILRFWENYSIEEIAEEFGMDWNSVDSIIERTLKHLKRICLNDPKFSFNCEQTNASQEVAHETF